MGIIRSLMMSLTNDIYAVRYLHNSGPHVISGADALALMQRLAAQNKWRPDDRYPSLEKGYGNGKEENKAESKEREPILDCFRQRAG